MLPHSKHYPALALSFFFILAIVVYLPGLNGDFLFDDFPNLEPIGHYGQVDNWESAKAFITSGFSGPTGRPISLASFLLDDNTWPSYAPWFKQTNLLIHLLCGLLLCWAVLLLMRNLKPLSGLNEQQAQWVAVLTCALWLLHPYMVSTTLYVVQRMAQLAALFSLMGIVLYLQGRLWLTTKPIKAYVFMTFGIGAGTVLATYSKENGALLALLILSIEFCLPKDENKPRWPWRAVLLWLPSLAIAYKLIGYINFSPDIWPTRNFNQMERLLTEGRIVTEYLLHLFVPRIEGNGLYQDGFIISTGWLQPLSTLLSVIFLGALLLFALIVRKKLPVVSIAILFFFAAHLMESTVVGLELYFEHRNYLAALFLFMPIAYYAVILAKHSKLVPLIMCLIVSLLAGMTYLRADLWSDSDQLELYWAQAASNSPRALNSLTTHIVNSGQPLQALAFVDEASQRLPGSSFLTIRVLMLKVQLGLATESDFLQTTQRLQEQKFDTQTVKGFRVLAVHIVDHQRHEYGQPMIELLQTFRDNKQYRRSTVFMRVAPYLQARLHLMLGNTEQAFELYSEAVNRYKRTSSSLQMVAELGIAAQPALALKLLDIAWPIFLKEPEKSLDRGREAYEEEFEYLRQVLEEDLQNR